MGALLDALELSAEKSLNPWAKEDSDVGSVFDSIGWLGESLGKPGRAVRGMLGGQGIGALKNLVPFSDTFGLTNPENDVSGRDLLKQWGMVGEDDSQVGWDDAAGFGLEMLLDPTTFGVGSKLAGKLGNKLGTGILNRRGIPWGVDVPPPTGSIGGLRRIPPGQRPIGAAFDSTMDTDTLLRSLLG